MTTSKRHRTNVQYLIEALRFLREPKVSREKIGEILRENEEDVSTYIISSAIRELLRLGVLERKRAASKYKYHIRTADLEVASEAVTSMKNLPGTWTTVHNRLIQYPVLSRRQIEEMFSEYSVVDIDRLIMKLQRTGLIAKLNGERSRGKYIVQRTQDNERFLADPVTGIVSILGPEILFCYNTALELHGLSRYGITFVIYVHGSRPERLKSFGNATIKHVHIRSEENGKTSLERRGTLIHLTDRERTIIDCVHRPKYSVGWENVLYALQKVEHVDADRILSYLKPMRIPSLFAKIGLISERFQGEWGIDDEILRRIQQFRPRNPIRFFSTEPGRLIKRWNIYVPEGLFDQV